MNKLATFKIKNPSYTCIYGCINEKTEKQTLTGSEHVILHNNVEIKYVTGNKLLELILDKDKDLILQVVKETIHNFTIKKIININICQIKKMV